MSELNEYEKYSKANDRIPLELLEHPSIFGHISVSFRMIHVSSIEERCMKR